MLPSRSIHAATFVDTDRTGQGFSAEFDVCADGRAAAWESGVVTWRWRR